MRGRHEDYRPEVDRGIFKGLSEVLSISRVDEGAENQNLRPHRFWTAGRFEGALDKRHEAFWLDARVSVKPVYLPGHCRPVGITKTSFGCYV